MIRLETYSENKWILDKISGMAVEKQIASIGILTEAGIVIVKDGAKYRAKGYKLEITTKEENRDSVIQLILSNHNEPKPQILESVINSATSAADI